MSQLRFAEFLLDTDQRQLLGDGEEIHLHTRAFRLLEILIENRPRVVSKEDLYEQLWPKTFVEASNLPSLIAEIRRALGDQGRKSRFIRTVHKFGYAFRGDVEVSDAANESKPSSWSLLWKGKEIQLQEGDNVLGRDADTAILVDDPSVSRQHARIRIEDQKATLEDLHSKNGTRLRGEKVSAPMTLIEGDQFTLGSAKLTFRAARRNPSTITMIEQLDG